MEIVSHINREIVEWKLRTRSLELGCRTLVMGVVNITPDSFSDGGLFLDADAAVAQALKHLDEGADIIDLGAESTRPDSRVGPGSGESNVAAVSAEEEQARLLPVLKGVLAARPDAIISVDTYKAATARAALQAGAEIVNDVSGFNWDDEMPRVCAELKAGIVLMHTRGRPEEWHTQPQLPKDELLALIRAGLESSLSAAARAGVANDAIVIDPGYGFGKRFDENYTLLAHQREQLTLGRPLLAGVSRKSFLGHTLAKLHGGSPAPVAEREIAGIAAMVAGILNGTSIVRVHAVRPAVEAALIADAVLAARQ